MSVRVKVVNIETELTRKIENGLNRSSDLRTAIEKATLDLNLNIDIEKLGIGPYKTCTDLKWLSNFFSIKIIDSVREV